MNQGIKTAITKMSVMLRYSLVNLFKSHKAVPIVKAYINTHGNECGMTNLCMLNQAIVRSPDSYHHKAKMSQVVT